MGYIFSLLIGLLIGILIHFFLKPESAGTLKVDYTDLDGPYLFVELNGYEWFQKLEEKKEISLKVKIRK